MTTPWILPDQAQETPKGSVGRGLQLSHHTCGPPGGTCLTPGRRAVLDEVDPLVLPLSCSLSFFDATGKQGPLPTQPLPTLRLQGCPPCSAAPASLLPRSLFVCAVPLNENEAANLISSPLFITPALGYDKPIALCEFH